MNVPIRRIIAVFIDIILVRFLQIVVYSLDVFDNIIHLEFMFIIVLIAYFIASDYFGSSLGKWIMQIRAQRQQSQNRHN